jgi:hypothetical protein
VSVALKGVQAVEINVSVHKVRMVLMPETERVDNQHEIVGEKQTSNKNTEGKVGEIVSKKKKKKRKGKRGKKK